MPEIAVIHYGEIGIKGKNRKFFEKKLIENIKKALGKNAKRVYRRYGRIVAEVESFEKAKHVLEKIPGIEYFSQAERAENDIEKIKKSVLKILERKNFKTFKIETKRSYKQFPLTSLEVNRIIGEIVVNSLGKKVSLENPDITVYIEICEKESFIYTEKFCGIGGIPVTASGKVICLLSGGIDSAVAGFFMMKRGCEVIFVHFFNRTVNTEAVVSKINNIVKKLTEFQLSSKLYLVPFEDIQKEIIKNVPSKYRMIIYRRFMTRIANEIAKTENAKVIVTGDNLAQVASQTLDNLSRIYEISSIPIIAPLIGMNKNEIIELAKKIGTYEISILPYQDCCSLLISPHPVTRCKRELIEEFEKSFSIDKLVRNALKKSYVITFNL